MQIHSLIIKDGNRKETYQTATDGRGKGINRDTTMNKILPLINNAFELGVKSFKHEGFRYYMNQCITSLELVMNDGSTKKANLVSTKATSINILKY